MFNDFDPKERKAIILFLAFLMLGLVYVVTHPEKFESNGPKPLQVPQDAPVTDEKPLDYESEYYNANPPSPVNDATYN